MNREGQKPRITIQYMPIRNRGYFEWIYTGLQILHEKGEIELLQEGSSWEKFLRKHPRVWGKFDQKFPELSKLLFPVDHFSMFGRIEQSGKSMRFSYDVTDSPFTYSLAHLELSDLYFKGQCPIEFEEEGYPLSNTVRVPYHPYVLEARDKIRPCMSTGAITSTFDLKRNLKVLESNASIRVASKKNRIFASFGGDQGPRAWETSDLPPAPHNFRNERSIVSLYGEQIQHPNEKRAEIVRILRKWGFDDIDARIWNSKDSTIQGDALAWPDYLKTVCASAFNVNVSGFRRSLPFRFLDSFQVGCGIATDTLGVKWYVPFDQEIEVVEYGDLGYESMENTDWGGIENRLREIYDGIDLSKDSGDELRQMFAKKWHPESLGRYFINECKLTIDQ